MRQITTKEEHDRMHRRRQRQAVGFVAFVLMVIGLGTLFGAAWRGIASLLDQSDQMAEYQTKLEGFVLFDPLPFSGIGNMDDNTLHEVAVWGCIYNIQETGGTLDDFERDGETEQMLLPVVEVDAYLAKIVGSSFKMTHRSFEMEDMSIEYDDARKAYLIPVTGGVGSYRPKVKALTKKNGVLYVTVGYIPLANSEDLTASGTDEPSKYMDYLFERVHGSWYLVGLEDNTTETVATVSNSETAVTEIEDADIRQSIEEGAGVESKEPTAEETEEDASSAEERASGEAPVEMVGAEAEQSKK